jgi:hypothetical protein
MDPVHRHLTAVTPLLTRRRVAAVLGAAAVSTALTGCLGGSKQSPGGTVEDFSARFAGFEPDDEPNGDLSKVTWPNFILRAGGDIRELYEFQILNGDLMRYMPCFCGCHREDGHRSNRDCYVEMVNPDGSVVFDAMAPT